MSAIYTTWSRTGFRFLTGFLLLSATTFAAARAASAQGPDDAIGLEIPPISGVPGDSVEMAVVLDTTGHSVGGIQIDIEADPPLSIGITEAGRPDCWRNPEINKDFTSYSFPFRFDGQWNRMRALVLSLTNVDPIPDASLLFTCRVHIDADAQPGEYQLLASRLLGSTPQGEEISALSSGGSVLVADPAEGAVPLVEGTDQMSGGCAIPGATPSGTSWMLLALPAVLWWLRRKADARRLLAFPPAVAKRRS